MHLDHRICMAPLTRFRADDKHVQLPIAVEYYGQRASVPGTLLISEATFISPRAAGYNNVPGIWNDEQIAAWKKVTEAVHKKGCFIYLQLWALGRVAVPKNLERMEGGPFPVVGASAIPMTPVDRGGWVPKAMSKDEIKGFVQDYVQAAKNAVAAGFDGVEIHGANGYLINQFWEDVSNARTDEYGGSIQNRARFGLEVTRGIIGAIGAKRVGMRLSVFSGFQGMGMADPYPQYKYIVKALKDLDIAYLHLVESRVTGANEAAATAVFSALTRENDPLVEIWGNKPDTAIVLAGGFTPEKSTKAIDEIYKDYPIIIAYGRHYISTPDLPYRVKEGLDLTPYDRSTFYKKMSPDGYIDQPFSKEYLAKYGERSRL